MHTGDHARIGAAAHFPINSSMPVMSFSPVVLPAPGRTVDLQLRVTVPPIGDNLPILLLSHGQGRSNWLSSMEGYAPLYEFYAAHGFAVLMPTHLRSAFLGLQPSKGNELFWKDGALDMTRILDNLDSVEAAVPGLKGRLDRSRVAVVGHSAGAWSSTLLLGAANTDPRDGSTFYKPETRIKAGVTLGGLGNGGADLLDVAKERIPQYGPDFSKMSTPTLVVYGDEDISTHFTSRDAHWHADSYVHSPGAKDLLVLKGAKHGLGGISGWDAGETLDESPERLAFLQRMTWAYLWSQLYEGDGAWTKACKVFEGLDQGKVESKK